MLCVLRAQATQAAALACMRARVALACPRACNHPGRSVDAVKHILSHTVRHRQEHTHTLGGAHHRKCDATSRPLVENYNKQTILGAF
jgi:hypothetical protein